MHSTGTGTRKIDVNIDMTLDGVHSAYKHEWPCMDTSYIPVQLPMLSTSFGCVTVVSSK